MKAMRVAVIILFLLNCLWLTKVSAQLYRPVAQRSEKWALAKIAALPEVKKFMIYAKAEEPELLLQRSPDSTYHLYWISMGVSKGGMFRTSANYYVNPKNGQIYIGDVMNRDDDIDIWKPIPIELYRKDRRYHLPHKYVNGKLVVIKK